MYIPKHFVIQELVWPEFHAEFKARGDTMFMAFDARALLTLDRLRERYGKLTVNDWLWGGEFRLSGLRPLGSGTGAALSQHVFGRAFDCKFKNVPAAEVRDEVRSGRLRGPGEVFEHVTRIEDFPGMGWFHFDTGNHDAAHDGVLVVTPHGMQ